MDKLQQIIESILFLSGDAVAISDIAAKLNVTTGQTEAAAKALREKYSGESGIHLLIFNKKLQFCSNPDYADSVETVLNPIKERELSRTMMEVAAIIAYKQPVTRLEVEEIRGVNSDYALLTLTKHNIIEVVGRKDAIGKPLLYGTTDGFLKRFQLSSLSQLPDYEELLGRIEVLHSESKDLYYKEQYTGNGAENEGGEDAFGNADALISSVEEEGQILAGLKELEAERAGNVHTYQDISRRDGHIVESTAYAEAAATVSGEDVTDSEIDAYGDIDMQNAESDLDTNSYEVQSDDELPEFLIGEKDLKIISGE